MFFTEPLLERARADRRGDIPASADCVRLEPPRVCLVLSRSEDRVIPEVLRRGGLCAQHEALWPPAPLPFSRLFFWVVPPLTGLAPPRRSGLGERQPA